jgi:hypothetical protein
MSTYIVKKRTISLEKQGKFKVGVVPVDKLGCVLLRYVFVIMKGGSLAISAVANTVFWANLIVLHA